jgi:hypothetical protein
MQRQLVALACSGLLLTLAACGGGGDPIGGDTVFSKPVAAAAPSNTGTGGTTDTGTGTDTGTPTAPTVPTQTLALRNSSSTLLEVAMGAASTGSAVVADTGGVTLYMTSLTGLYDTTVDEVDDLGNFIRKVTVKETLTLQVSFAQGNPNLYFVGMKVGDDGTVRQCVSANWTEAQLRAIANNDPDFTAPSVCDGSITIDATNYTIEAKNVTALTESSLGATDAVLTSFSLALPKP